MTWSLKSSGARNAREGALCVRPLGLRLGVTSVVVTDVASRLSLLRVTPRALRSAGANLGPLRFSVVDDAKLQVLMIGGTANLSGFSPTQICPVMAGVGRPTRFFFPRSWTPLRPTATRKR